MSSVAAGWYYSGIDISGQARVWSQDSSSAQRRMLNRSLVLRTLIDGANHMLGRQMRPLAMMAQPGHGMVYDNGSSPLYWFSEDDEVVNARSRTMRVLALPTGFAVGANAYARSNTGAVTPVIAYGLASYPTTLVYHEAPFVRGSPTGVATLTEQISTYEGYCIMDMVVQDDVVPRLDDDYYHDMTDWRSIYPGAPVVDGVMESMRACHARHRAASKPLLMCWLGQASGNAWQTVTPSAAEAFVVTSETAVNIINTDITARSATSPGTTCSAQYMGTGRSNTIGVTCAILAQMNNGTGTFDFVGPVTNATISVTATTPTWYYANGLNLYTNVADSVTSASRNKIDPMARVTATSTMYVYAIQAWALP